MEAPTGRDKTRPTSAKVREALMSIIAPYLEDSVFIDLFAGSGSIAFEAISRGAEYAQLYEIDSNNINIIKKNSQKLKLHNLEINKINLLDYNNFNIKYNASVVFIDPPYSLKPFSKIINVLKKNKNITNETIIILETNEAEFDCFENEFKVIDKKKYGKSFLIYIMKN